jgi:hypothetical protein
MALLGDVEEPPVFCTQAVILCPLLPPFATA